MEHHFIDRYSELDSPVHRCDSRVKFITLLFFIIYIISRGPITLSQFILWLVLLALPTLLSRVPTIFILKRSLLIFPFVFMIGLFLPFLPKEETTSSYNLGFVNYSYTGLVLFQNLLAKSYLSILALILTTSTTPFSQLLMGMQKLKVPRIILLLASFMYRYFFVFIDETMKMNQGREARLTRKSGFQDFRVLGRMIGTLFVRSYERAERVYQAMLARGFEGFFPISTLPPPKATDIVAAIVFATITVLIGR